jgi:hypothetical protein
MIKLGNSPMNDTTRPPKKLPINVQHIQEILPNAFAVTSSSFLTINGTRPSLH